MGSLRAQSRVQKAWMPDGQSRGFQMAEMTQQLTSGLHENRLGRTTGIHCYFS